MNSHEYDIRTSAAGRLYSSCPPPPRHRSPRSPHLTAMTTTPTSPAVPASPATTSSAESFADELDTLRAEHACQCKYRRQLTFHDYRRFERLIKVLSHRATLKRELSHDKQPDKAEAEEMRSLRKTQLCLKRLGYYTGTGRVERCSR